MSTAYARVLLLLDSLFMSLVGLRNAPRGSAPRRHSPGASLPGGQTHLTVEVVDDGRGDPYLRTGASKHSMWRTVEWRLLREVVPGLGEPVLDLGCGDGTFGSLLRDRIDLGVDGDADAVARCDRELYAEARTADMRERIPAPDGSLAAAFSNSTLEHVTPLAPALRATARAMRPGGLVVITVPTAGFTRAVASRFGAAYAARLNALLGHHNLWTWDRWREELQAAGFTVEEIRGYQSDRASTWYAGRSLFPWTWLARRAPGWLWNHDREQIRALAADSLAVRDEDETSCALIFARRRDGD